SLVAPSSEGRDVTRVRPTSRSGGEAAAPPKRASHSSSKWLLVALPVLFLVGGYLAVRSIWNEAEASRAKARAAASAAASSTKARPRGDAGTVISRARKVADSGDNSAAMEILDAWTRNPANAGHPDLGRVELELAALNDKVGRSDQALAI